MSTGNCRPAREENVWLLSAQHAWVIEGQGHVAGQLRTFDRQDGRSVVGGIGRFVGVEEIGQLLRLERGRRHN